MPRHKSVIIHCAEVRKSLQRSREFCRLCNTVDDFLRSAPEGLRGGEVFGEQVRVESQVGEEQQKKEEEVKEYKRREEGRREV